MRPLRIIFTYTAIGTGGDAVQTLAITSALRNLGHEVQLVGPHEIRPYDFATPLFGLPRWVFRKPPTWLRDLMIDFGLGFRTRWKARRIMKRQKFDLVIHRAHIYDFLGSWLAKSTHSPVVVFLDAPFAEEWEMAGKHYYKRIHRFAMRRLTRDASLLVTVSEFSRRYYLEFGVAPEKILVQPNGISEVELQQGITLAGERPPFIRSDVVTIGFVGSFAPWHRVDLLLEAIKQLSLRGGARYEAVIIGMGSKFNESKELCQRLGLDGQVQWLGALPHEEAYQKFRDFDVAVLPHTLPTGTPMKLLEYAAMARPIIAPDLPNIRDVFEQDEDIVLFEPGNPSALADAIESLHANPDRARRLGQRAQEKMQNYTWEKQVSRMLEKLYEIVQLFSRKEK